MVDVAPEHSEPHIADTSSPLSSDTEIGEAWLHYTLPRRAFGVRKQWEDICTEESFSFAVKSKDGENGSSRIFQYLPPNERKPLFELNANMQEIRVYEGLPTLKDLERKVDEMKKDLQNVPSKVGAVRESVPKKGWISFFLSFKFLALVGLTSSVLLAVKFHYKHKHPNFPWLSSNSKSTS